MTPVVKRDGRSRVPYLGWLTAADDAEIGARIPAFYQMLRRSTRYRQRRDHRRLAQEPSIREPFPYKFSDLIVVHTAHSILSGAQGRRTRRDNPLRIDAHPNCIAQPTAKNNAPNRMKARIAMTFSTTVRVGQISPISPSLSAFEMRTSAMTANIGRSFLFTLLLLQRLPGLLVTLQRTQSPRLASAKVTPPHGLSRAHHHHPLRLKGPSAPF